MNMKKQLLLSFILSIGFIYLLTKYEMRININQLDMEIRRENNEPPNMPKRFIKQQKAKWKQTKL